MPRKQISVKHQLTPQLADSVSPRSAYSMYIELRQAEKLLTYRLKQELRTFKISVNEWLVLSEIAKRVEDGLTASVLASSLFMTPSQVSVATNRLKAVKLLRHRTNRNDYRSRHLLLTTRSRLLLKNSEAQLKSALEAYFSSRGPLQLLHYHQTLEELSKHLTTHGKIGEKG